MTIYTDAPGIAAPLLPTCVEGPFRPLGEVPAGMAPILDALLPPDLRFAAPGAPEGWEHVIVREDAPTSQYDALIALARGGTPLPHGLVGLAGRGSRFHGTRGRPWVACPGNLHLVAHLTPRRPVERFGTVFVAMAASAVVTALDRIPGLEGRAGIKWVNDVVVDGHKVGGALAYSQTQGEEVSTLVLGVGLNVETRPEVDRNPGVPPAACLRDLVPDPERVALGTTAELVLDALARGYTELLMKGPAPIMERYRSRSTVLDREVVVREDPEGETGEVLASGRVTGVGDGLELYLEGRQEPVTRGRLEWRT